MYKIQHYYLVPGTTCYVLATDHAAIVAKLKAELAEAKAGWDSCIADLREASRICKNVEAELAEEQAELLQPAVLCENCDLYYADSIMQMTEDDVSLCPGCWEALSEEMESIAPPEPSKEK